MQNVKREKPPRKIHFYALHIASEFGEHKLIRSSGRRGGEFVNSLRCSFARACLQLRKNWNKKAKFPEARGSVSNVSHPSEAL